MVVYGLYVHHTNSLVQILQGQNSYRRGMSVVTKLVDMDVHKTTLHIILTTH
jgi:hypothetical protein